MFPNNAILIDRAAFKTNTAISTNTLDIKNNEFGLLRPLSRKCCDTLIDWLSKYHKKCDESFSNCKYSTHLVECLPNINYTTYVYDKLNEKGMVEDKRTTCLHLQLSFAKIYFNFYSRLPFNIIYLNKETCLIKTFQQLNIFGEEIYGESSCLVHIAFTTYVINIEKLVQFNSIGSVSLYLPRNMTEQILVRWISYLKFQGYKCWNHIVYLIIENVPTSLILYDLLCLLPSLNYLIVGSNSVSMIDDVPLLKKSLAKTSNRFVGRINDNLLKYDFDCIKNTRKQTSNFLNVLYSDYSNQMIESCTTVDLQEFSVLKRVLPLNKHNGKNTFGDSRSNSIGKKVMKRPRSNLKTLFGHKI